MEEAIWSLSQQSKVLQDLRKDIRGVWRDEAARDINSRYLDSHEADSEQMIAAMREQNNAIERSDAKLEYARNWARAADECAVAVMEKLQLLEQDLINSFSAYDLYIKYNSDARSKFPQVYELIERANNSCD